MKEGKSKVHLIQLGCSKNQVDSEDLLGEFATSGFTVSTVQKDAAFVLINTCGFIQSAKEESIAEILQAVKRRAPGQKIVVAGCLSARYREELREELPEVDAFFGTYKAGEILTGLGLTSPADCPSPPDRVFLDPAPHHAYLKIAEGCNRICGFCAIPGMRGKQVSRSIAELVREAQSLQSRGIVELSLVAQDLTFYGREKISGENLTGLLEALLTHTEIPWIRLMYAYPAYLDDNLLALIANETRICNYIDIPIQHSSARMLKAMRRGYSNKQLNQVLTRIREKIPQVSLRTTVLVGYPGETREDFKNLLNFIQAYRFERLGGFLYSDEDGTHAAGLEDKVPENEAKERLNELMEKQQEISLQINEQKVGQILDVLIDEADSGEQFNFLGRTEADAPSVDNSVCIRGESAVPGTFRRVKIENAWEFDLEGSLLPEI